MTRRWRWIDTGVLPAAENMALNRALFEARQAGEASSTLRFLRFRPAALVGRHGDPLRELDLAYCRAQGIALQRRITGGGPIYMDEGVLGWELYLERDDVGTAEMPAISRRICAAAARAIVALGAPAEFRAPTEIVVAGRKISGTGGAIEDNALVYQGTLLLDFDIGVMLHVLAATARSLNDAVLAGARAGVINLREVLGRVPAQSALRTAFIGAFGAEFAAQIEEGELNDAERRRFDTALAEMDTAEWIGTPSLSAPLASA
jgi:lipoate-protein ligase A